MERAVSLQELARPERFELPTPWFEARYSIQLSYGRVWKSRTGLCGERANYTRGGWIKGGHFFI